MASVTPDTLKTTDLSARLRADSLVETATEIEALRQLRELTGDTDGPMERHGVRCFLICERLAVLRGTDIDREAMLVAALLHDIGLYDGASKGGVYVTDGRDFTAELLSGREGWDPARTELCLNAIERHHEVRSQWEAGDEVEFLRRADLLELSFGGISFGTDKAWRNQLFAAVPRKGLVGELAKMVGKAVRERPLSIPKIFARGR